jgi:hypothetical protein
MVLAVGTVQRDDVGKGVLVGSPGAAEEPHKVGSVLRMTILPPFKCRVANTIAITMLRFLQTV